MQKAEEMEGGGGGGAEVEKGKTGVGKWKECEVC
jgi:hypothetical protein